IAAERIGDRKQQRDHDPEQRGVQCLGETPPEHEEHQAAHDEADRNLGGEPSEILAREAPDQVFLAAEEKDEQRQGQPDQQRPKQTSGQNQPPSPAPACSVRAAILPGSSAMIRRRSSGENAVQRAISASVRPQPTQYWDPESSTQTLMHGLSISAMPAPFANARGNIKGCVADRKGSSEAADARCRS